MKGLFGKLLKFFCQPFDGNRQRQFVPYSLLGYRGCASHLACSREFFSAHRFHRKHFARPECRVRAVRCVKAWVAKNAGGSSDAQVKPPIFAAQLAVGILQRAGRRWRRTVAIGWQALVPKKSPVKPSDVDAREGAMNCGPASRSTEQAEVVPGGASYRAGVITFRPARVRLVQKMASATDFRRPSLLDAKRFDERESDGSPHFCCAVVPRRITGTGRQKKGPAENRPVFCPSDVGSNTQGL